MTNGNFYARNKKKKISLSNIMVIWVYYTYKWARENCISNGGVNTKKFHPLVFEIRSGIYTNTFMASCFIIYIWYDMIWTGIVKSPSSVSPKNFEKYIKQQQSNGILVLLGSLRWTPIALLLFIVIHFCFFYHFATIVSRKNVNRKPKVTVYQISYFSNDGLFGNFPGIILSLWQGLRETDVICRCIK